jgi:hypothetical protein
MTCAAPTDSRRPLAPGLQSVSSARLRALFRAPGKRPPGKKRAQGLGRLALQTPHSRRQ